MPPSKLAKKYSFLLRNARAVRFVVRYIQAIFVLLLFLSASATSADALHITPRCVFSLVIYVGAMVAACALPFLTKDVYLDENAMIPGVQLRRRRSNKPLWPREYAPLAGRL